ncbi:MAG: GGDEF and EAL domain-containing protein, partial [Pseudomonadota bacterium]
ITVDRSIVPPAIVNRMFLYFVLATVKNTILGILLVAVVYGALARHIINLAELTGNWMPGNGTLKVPAPPKLFADTELETLGQRIEQLSTTASGIIKEIEDSRQAVLQSNDELTVKSEYLSQAIELQNQELRRTNSLLKDLAEKDDLTGLLNRRSFDQCALEILDEAVKRQEPVSVLLIDVDHFKAYNDYYGHQLGDACLTRISTELKACTDYKGALLARYGGEEFIVIASGKDRVAVEALCAAMHEKVRQAAILHDRSSVSSHITISIGCASNDNAHGSESWTLDRLISAADDALYEAKRNGRKRTEYSNPALRKRLKDQRYQRRQLLEAVERASFEPYFQPQFDCRTGEMVGAEVLARWRREDGSVAGPQTFMTNAIECGFMPQIDRLVLDGVERLLADASDRGLTLPRVSLNVPRENLESQNYVDDLIRLAEQGDTPIVVELLETAIFDRPDDDIALQLDTLRDVGIEVEIDDFGTGHTSLVSLMAVRPSRLKIAKELILPVLESEEHRKLTLTVVQLSRALDIDVLAEGVETQDIANYLASIGCTLHQGFHYAKPMTGDDFLEMLRPALPASQSRAVG